MGTTNSGKINESQGLEILDKYATLLGLNKKSGVELSESSPKVSDEQLVRSAIGQGTNSFAPIQIANYATTLANSGTVFDLSIMKEITDQDGNTVKKFKTKKKNTVKLNSNSYWNIVHSGMYGVVYDGHKDVFSSLKSVKIAVTVVLPFAYTSSNACNVAKDVYAYYFGSDKEKENLVESVERASSAASGSSD
jgi:penicillin-binding protein 2